MNKYAAIFAICLAIGVYALTLDEAREQLDNLTDRANYDPERAFELLNKVTDDIRELSRSELSTGSKEMKKQEARLSKDLEDIIKLANQGKVNISSCVGANGGSLKKLADVASLELVTCFNRFESHSISAVRQGLISINGILTDIFALRNKLISCEVNDAACINEVASQIAFANNDIPTRIQKELDTATIGAAVNRFYLSECAHRNVEDFYWYGSQVLVHIQKSVDLITQGSPSPRVFHLLK